jgi:ADP-ribose pyrophosphatase YjhB (NUDIX family)
MVKKLSEKVYREVYSIVPRLCVDLILKSKDSIVLVKRDISPCKGMWHLPGGTVLFGESLLEATKRVAREETNLRIEVKQLLGVKEYDKKSAFGQAISIVYLAEVVSGRMRGNAFGKEVKAFREIPKNTVKQHQELVETYVCAHAECV